MSSIQDQQHSDKKSSVQQQPTQTTLSDFKILTKLGEGAYSSVYKVIRLADLKEYALKKVKLMNLSDKERENALNEVRILASVKQKNVISYKEAFWDNEAQSLCIVMEYADNGDLFQKICEHQKKGTEFLENEIWKVFIQVVRALKALHEMRIMHRDLKSANVFLYKDWTAKLGDMNVSKLSNYKGLNYTQTGTPYYASPEVWKDEPYDSKSDIWSLGCVLYEMITLKPPFRADDMQGLYKRVLKGVYQKIPNHFSSDLSNVVTSLLQVKSQNRPSCDQILEMPVTIKRIEKFFPEEVIFDKSQMFQEIKVPKNFMYLTDKLPGPNYDQDKGKFYKNRSEAKLRLPKLGNSVIVPNYGNISSATLEYQLPAINNKNGLHGSISIQEQMENSNINIGMQSNNRNLQQQQQQIIIQVKPNKDKSKSQVKGVSSLHQQSEQKPKIQPIQMQNNDQQQLLDIIKDQQYCLQQNSNALQTPGKTKIKAISNQDDSLGKKSKITQKSRQSSRLTSAKRETIISNNDNNVDSVLAQQRSIGDERTSALSQNDLIQSENQDLTDDLPQPITSKSPNLKSYSSKLQQIQQANNLSRNQQQQNRVVIDESKKQTVNLNPSNNILQGDDDTPKKQYGYRYASLQPQKRDNDIDQTPQLPKLPQIRKIAPSPQLQINDYSSLQNVYQVKQQYQQQQNTQQGNNLVRSLSPYRNPSLLQPINSKQDLYKLKHSVVQQQQMPMKSQSSGKLPKLKGQEQLLRQMSKHHNYYMKGSPKLQNMYYRVANSYLKSYQPQMNIVGNSVKNSYQIYGSVNSRSQIEDPQLLPASSYFQAPLKPKKIMQLHQKADMLAQQQKQIQQTKEANQIYFSSVIDSTQTINNNSNSNTHNNNPNNNNQVINHALLARPIKKHRLINQQQNSHQLSIDLTNSNNVNNNNMMGLPKNQSQVLLKYQIQETIKQ